ncbi:MAG: tyrosine-type recombinase/integrase [Pseudonocardia sp.]|nr:tyrosine-type recombinase/integrase [Pseudonocardia sp.]
MTTWPQSLAEYRARLARQGSRAAPLSARTQVSYLADVRRVAGWLTDHGVAGPEHITASSLEAAFRGLGWSTATRARALTAVREWLAPGWPAGRSPADLVERPKVVAPPIPRLSVADATVLVEAEDERGAGDPLAVRDRALVELLYGSGLRRQEICDLVLAGLDFEHETVRVVGKGGRARTVPLTEPSVACLQAWVRDARGVFAAKAVRAPDAVFLTRSGRPMDGSAVYRVVARRLRAMGRGGGPHLLRHAAASHLLDGDGEGGGAHLRVVQEVLGHASLATTQRYTGVTTKSIQAALRRGHPRG